MPYFQELSNFISDPNKLNAASTAIIALFTIVLAFVGGLQSRRIKQTVELARAEFNSSHRPHIIVRDVCRDGRSIAYLLVNKGDATAEIVESWIAAEFVPDGKLLRPLRSLGHDDLGRISLKPGELKEMTCQMPDEIGFAMTFPESRRIGIEGAPAVHGHTYFTGTLIYEDNNGFRRRSVFRRLWNQERDGFERLSDPDLEYAD